MIKTEIIGFCQKINRIVRLVELSDPLTRKRRHGGCCRGGGGGQECCFFCPSDFLSPYCCEYTNDEPLRTN